MPPKIIEGQLLEVPRKCYRGGSIEVPWWLKEVAEMVTPVWDPQEKDL